MAAPKLATIPEPVDLSETIRRISEAMDRLLRSGLKREAVVVLLRHETNLSKRDINNVLNSLQDLAKQYTTDKK